MSNLADIINALPLLSRSARAALGWSQEEVSRKSDIPKTTLARFEALSGNLTSFQSATLLDLYDEAGVSFEGVYHGIQIYIEGDTIFDVLENMKNPEKRRSDYKGIRPINAPFNEEELLCMDEIERKLKEAYGVIQNG